MNPVHIIGGGLAGSEAAYQLAKRNIPVIIYEMRPDVMTPAHSGGGFAELVCSNSLKAEATDTGSGLLKAELELMDSLLIRIAKECRVPAGGSLAVDREMFSARVTETLSAMENVRIMRGGVR
ncbi:MAG: FAD-dependent oxidoreductase, partial [Geovibrio sp.]|nr:FAD-dependent oxidoreductase [Geovibrio sp.]